LAKVAAVRLLALNVGAEVERRGRSSIWIREAWELGSIVLALPLVVVVGVGRMKKENIGSGRGRRHSVYRSKRSSLSRKRAGAREERVVRRVRRRRRRFRESRPPWEARGEVALLFVGVWGVLVLGDAEAGESCLLRVVLDWRREVRADFCCGVLLESESESK
jgi:hypothetical protein